MSAWMTETKGHLAVRIAKGINKCYQANAWTVYRAV